LGLMFRLHILWPCQVTGHLSCLCSVSQTYCVDLRCLQKRVVVAAWTSLSWLPVHADVESSFFTLNTAHQSLIVHSVYGVVKILQVLLASSQHVVQFFLG